MENKKINFSLNYKWIAVIAILLIFSIGFFSGMEYQKYVIKKKIETAFEDVGKAFTGIFKEASDAPESKSDKKKEKKPQKEIVNFRLNEKISTETFNIQVNSFEFTMELLPSDTRYFYTPLVPKDDEVLFFAKASIFNKAQDNLSIEDMFKKITLVYDNKYNYNGAAVVDDGTMFDEYGSILPLSEKTVYFPATTTAEVDIYYGRDLRLDFETEDKIYSLILRPNKDEI